MQLPLAARRAHRPKRAPPDAHMFADGAASNNRRLVPIGSRLLGSARPSPIELHPHSAALAALTAAAAAARRRRRRRARARHSRAASQSASQTAVQIITSSNVLRLRLRRRPARNGLANVQRSRFTRGGRRAPDASRDRPPLGARQPRTRTRSALSAWQMIPIRLLPPLIISCNGGARRGQMQMRSQAGGRRLMAAFER